MLLLLSGEGKSDLGCCDMGLSNCSGEQFIPGPMAWFVDQLIEDKLDFSHIDNTCCYFIPEKKLTEIAKRSLDPFRFPGKKQKKETGFFYKNARALAVLFRDADRTQSSSRGEWQDKWDSMVNGFSSQGFDYGVPMLAEPKSEAWLLCAVKDKPYQHCQQLEKCSGNDNSPESLKTRLAHALNDKNSSEELSQDGTG